MQPRPRCVSPGISSNNCCVFALTWCGSSVVAVAVGGGSSQATQYWPFANNQLACKVLALYIDKLPIWHMSPCTLHA